MNRIFVGFLFIVTVLLKISYSQEGLNNILPKDSCFFPYYFVKDDQSPAYTKFRAEGSNTRQIVFHAFKYSRKYLHKKTSSDSAEMKYFENQAKVFEWISAHKTSETGNSIKIGLVGDLMWIRNNWNSFLDKDVLDVMQGYHFFIGNLETPIDKNRKVKSFLFDYFKYNADTGLITSFLNKDKTSLFKVVSLANNHIVDAGESGVNATLEFLNKQNILSSGVYKNKNDKPFTTFVVNNIKFGFYAACWGVNNTKKLEKAGLKLNIIKGIAPIGKDEPDLNEVKNVLKEMDDEGVDFKIISLHWGAEYEMYPDVQQIIMAREIVKGGADLILGHHPHLIQPFEVYFLNGYTLKDNNDGANPKDFSFIMIEDGSKKPRKALVLYSLGNFTTEMLTEACRTGMIFGISVFRTNKNRVDWNIEKITTTVNERNGGPKRSHKLKIN